MLFCQNFSLICGANFRVKIFSSITIRKYSKHELYKYSLDLYVYTKKPLLLHKYTERGVELTFCGEKVTERFSKLRERITILSLSFFPKSDLADHHKNIMTFTICFYSIEWECVLSKFFAIAG